ncbi:hypothetical protein [Frateuria defendens]|uniref:hypothetical protein n=1 Tax=Frateuria defendens TaxID=2219559 RepID=UPI00066FF1B6|nr:hypothetical protein [Frateuria defendens]
MKVVYSLREETDGAWSICRGPVVLFRQLRLGPAIKLARELARDEHRRSSRDTAVELPGPHSAIELARYVRSPMVA